MTSQCEGHTQTTHHRLGEGHTRGSDIAQKATQPEITKRSKKHSNGSRSAVRNAIPC